MSRSEWIHPSAIIEDGAELAEGVRVGAFSIIGPNVKIGAETEIGSHVVINGHTSIGQRNKIFQFCSIGERPQDLTYDDQPTRVEIGDDNVIREYVSIHRGTLKQDKITKVGSSCLIMAHAHLGHDVVVGDHCVIVNSVNLAGHVTIEDRVIISGATNISQFIRLGRGSYIGGASGVDRDIPPFCTAYGNRIKLKGINIVGLRRQSFEKPLISEAVDFYRTMEASPLSPRSFVDSGELMNEYEKNEIVEEISDFIKASRVGIAPFNFDV